MPPTSSYEIPRFFCKIVLAHFWPVFMSWRQNGLSNVSLRRLLFETRYGRRYTFS